MARVSNHEVNMHASNSFKDVSDPCDASESEDYGDGNLGHTALPLIGTLYLKPYFIVTSRKSKTHLSEYNI